MVEEIMVLRVAIVMVAVMFILSLFFPHQNITPMDLEQYKAGFTDGMINEITKLIFYCIPENIEVFRGVDSLNRQWGLIYVCPNNSTYIFDQNESMIMVKYSKERYKS